MPELSPAAQAIEEIIADLYDLPVRCVVAAALCAVADQVVPDELMPTADSAYELYHWTIHKDRYYQRQQTRRDLLAIAAELEGQALQPPTQPTTDS